MFDIKTVPKIVIREGIINDVEIKKHGPIYMLYVNDQQWMVTDTASNLELREFYSSYDLAQGKVLLSGLGFGILPQWIASKDSVESVTVIELKQEVVNLFLRHNTPNPKINIKVADIKQYQDYIEYDWAIFDHYELDKVPTKKELNYLAKNLKFDNLWFWSLERRLTQYNSWQKFRQDYGLKIPDLSLDKVLHYMETLFRQKDFPLQK